MSVLKFGHRGAKGHLAENTLESIQKAIDFGVDAIEIDVHRCKTGEIIVFHDFTLDRTTDGSGEVAKKSWEVLKKLKVEEHFRIPLLKEVMDLISQKVRINIELKGLNTAVGTAAIIEDYISNGDWGYEDFLVSSFQKKELLQMHALNEKIPLAVLSKASVREAIELGKELGAKAIHPSLGIITRDSVRDSHQAGFNVNVWTVNEPKDILRMKEFGVDGIISDYPDRL